MQLHKTEDPRDSLQKARRKELFEFAKQHNVRAIAPDMPADLMRGILRQHGLTNIRTYHPPLGSTQQDGTGLERKYKNGLLAANGRAHETMPKGVEVDAMADLMRQYAQQKRDRLMYTRPYKSPVEMNIQEARQECLRQGIKLLRTYKLADLRDLLIAKAEADEAKRREVEDDGQ